MTTADFVSILEHDPDSSDPLAKPSIATKRMVKGTNGKLGLMPKPEGVYRYTVRKWPLECADDWLTLLLVLVKQPTWMIVRGGLRAGLEPKGVRATKNPKDGDPPYFEEIPHRWLWLDFDQVFAEELEAEEIDPTSEDAVKYVISRLPDYFHDRSCAWAHSSSASFKPGANLHIGFWLDRPLGETELKTWAASVNNATPGLIDWHTLQTVQLHYTAGPVFDAGIIDPLPKRCGLIRGSSDTVSFPDMSGAPKMLAKVRKGIQRISKDGQGLNDHVLRFAYHWPREHGAGASKEACFAELRAEVDAALARQGRVGDAKYTDDVLWKMIESGFARAEESLSSNAVFHLDARGGRKAILSNVLLALTSYDEWRGVLGYDERHHRVVYKHAPPFAGGVAGVAKESDWGALVRWFADVAQIPDVSESMILKSIKVVAMQNRFDPVQDYIRGLQWDGVPRLDTWLVRVYGADKQPAEYVRRVGRIMLISLVARALDPGARVESVPILESPNQGTFKTSSLRTLSGGFYRGLVGDLGDRDVVRRIVPGWVIEDSEGGSFGKAENKKRKEFITRTVDIFRAPYAHDDEEHPRRGCVVMTLNPEGEGYLDDPTGARRYHPVETRRVEDAIEWLEDHRDQLFAEAAAAYAAGEQWWVDPNDPLFVAEQNKRFHADVSWEALIADAFRNGCARRLAATTPPILPDSTTVRIPQILEHVIGIPTKDQDRKIQTRAGIAAGRVLPKLGWRIIRTNECSEWRKCVAPVPADREVPPQVPPI